MIPMYVPRYLHNSALDLACFKPFKTAFKEQRDVWTLLNKNKRVEKVDLCEWTSKALEATLTPKNIKARFKSSGIWPLDHATTRHAMKTSTGFKQEDGGDSKAKDGTGTILGRCLEEASTCGHAHSASMESAAGCQPGGKIQ